MAEERPRIEAPPEDPLRDRSVLFFQVLMGGGLAFFVLYLIYLTGRSNGYSLAVRDLTPSPPTKEDTHVRAGLPEPGAREPF